MRYGRRIARRHPGRSVSVFTAWARRDSLLKSALLGKVSFWLIVIGVFAMITPHPAWPEWLARMVLATGVALGITTIGVSLWRGRRKPDGK